jgi:hypothetical protein
MVLVEGKGMDEESTHPLLCCENTTQRQKATNPQIIVDTIAYSCIMDPVELIVNKEYEWKRVSPWF